MEKWKSKIRISTFPPPECLRRKEKTAVYTKHLTHLPPNATTARTTNNGDSDSRKFRSLFPLERELHRLGHGIASGAEHFVFRHLHNKPAAVAKDIGSRMLGGDDVGRERLPEGCLRILEIRLPKRAALCHLWVFAGDAVHEDIAATPLAAHSLTGRLREVDRCTDSRGRPAVRKPADADDRSVRRSAVTECSSRDWIESTRSAGIAIMA